MERMAASAQALEERSKGLGNVRQRPLGVSVCCITYNQAEYIQQALDSMLAQETSFPVEILVHDDCSTDGTVEVLREYEQQYPDVVRVVYEEHNRWDPKHMPSYIGDMLAPMARYRYLGHCEGDDYWCDPHKLQRQVDYLESHPDCALFGHQAQAINGRTGEKECLYGYGDKPLDVDGAYLIEHWTDQDSLPAASFVYRQELEIGYAREWRFSKYVGDLTRALYCAEHGYVHYDPMVASVYRHGSAGSFTTRVGRRALNVRREETALAYYHELDTHTGGKYHTQIMQHCAVCARNIAPVVGLRRYFSSKEGRQFRQYLSKRDKFYGMGSRFFYLLGFSPELDVATGAYRLRRTTPEERASDEAFVREFNARQAGGSC